MSREDTEAGDTETPDSAFATWIAALADRTTATSLHQPERN